MIHIPEIDCIILSYIEDDYYLYKLCKLNSYLTSLYENNNLWILKIELLFENLVISQLNAKKIYFDISFLSLRGYAKERLCKYAIKNNYVDILDWIFKYHKDKIKDEKLINKLFYSSCESGNLRGLIYVIDTFGIPEDELLSKSENNISYITSDNNKCGGICNPSDTHDGLIYAIENGHVDIIEYFEKYGMHYIHNTKMKMFPLVNTRNIGLDYSYQKGHYDVINWFDQRGINYY